ncbi:Nicotinamidase/isochorismatase family protein [Patulibacter medicamentivorans]|uniref:Nicotinamidase/isochorismatase family protein n=1 Tax=Patulibacter medicamentivorans TaxID=1097667 RepID=H0E4C6_9ACTN|nr:isochorismatase family cysteine hydrolase [Patulibacter medicamentivorans]EHN11471.1 Nicotinamidase/isochorismatase family protein [Patulibacter medicamentivorans]
MSAAAVVPARSVLLVIDVQGGSVAADDTGIPKMSPAAERLARVERIRTLVAAARGAGVPVVFVQEVHKRSGIDFGRELDGAEGVHALEGDPTTELAAGLEPVGDEYLIRKRRYSAFFATELELVLRSYGAEAVLLVGGLTDVCVHYTAVDAHQHDYRIRVITDCVGGSSQPAHDAALEAMRYLQRDAHVTSDAVLAALPDGAIELGGFPVPAG